MQVSGCFLYLDKSTGLLLVPNSTSRSHAMLFAQVSKPKFCEPCSRR
jgi:hypothetical protein